MKDVKITESVLLKLLTPVQVILLRIDALTSNIPFTWFEHYLSHLEPYSTETIQRWAEFGVPLYPATFLHLSPFVRQVGDKAMTQRLFVDYYKQEKVKKC